MKPRSAARALILAVDPTTAATPLYLLDAAEFGKPQAGTFGCLSAAGRFDLRPASCKARGEWLGRGPAASWSTPGPSQIVLPSNSGWAARSAAERTPSCQRAPIRAFAAGASPDARSGRHA